MFIDLQWLRSAFVRALVAGPLLIDCYLIIV